MKSRVQILTAMVMALWLLLPGLPGITAHGDEFSFDIEEFESSPFEWNGYAEIQYDHLDLDGDAAFYTLNFFNDPRTSLDRCTGTLQLELHYKRESLAFNAVLNAWASEDALQGSDSADIFEAVLSLKPSSNITLDLGKKMFKWGKGYAWNPVGFINRPKDLNNPEESMEGYTGVELDLIKSFDMPLQTLALTIAALPVTEDINDDFGKTGPTNFAAKLYLLYEDTDIDLALFSGGSRTTRYGIDFSKNLAVNFEVHGEYARLTDLEQVYIDHAGTQAARQRSINQYLLGLRYLTKNDITTILEYYHNGAGFSQKEIERFYELVGRAEEEFIQTDSESLLRQAKSVAGKGYGAPQAGRNYLYLKMNQKEPFDLLYFTPGIIGIFNLDDHSWSLSPEVVYTGFTNWNIRARCTFMGGGRFTEFKEKQIRNKAEIRIRFYF